MKEFIQDIGSRIVELCPEAYFVGGCVRDLVLGHPIKDVDLALGGDTYAVGRQLARTFGGHVFWLHEEEGVVRVVFPATDATMEGGVRAQLDLNPLRGTLKEDLFSRDLTFNAMAIPAGAGLVRGAEIIDPSGGLRDLAERTVRFVRPSAPESDPLRTLRALRFRWKLDCRLPEETVARIRECTPLLKRVSVERVRDELFQLLAMPVAAEALAEALDFGFGRWLTGLDREWPRENGMPAPAARVKWLLERISAAPLDLVRLLDQEVTPPRRRREVLLWAGALQAAAEIGGDPGKMSRYLALSNDERQLITKGLSAAARARELAEAWPIPGRLRYRFFRQAGGAGPEAVLLAACRSGWSPAYAELLDEALRRHFWPEPPLITGIEAMQILDLKPGPQIGRALEAVEEARADGLLRTPADAVEWLRERAASYSP